MEELVLHLASCPVCSVAALVLRLQESSADRYYPHSLLLTIVLINVMRSWFCGSSGNQDWVDLKGFMIRFPAEPHYFTFRMHGLNSPPSSCRLLQSNRSCWRWIPWLVLDQQLLPCILCKSIFFFFNQPTDSLHLVFCPSLCFHWSTKHLIQSLSGFWPSQGLLGARLGFAGTSEHHASPSTGLSGWVSCCMSLAVMLAIALVAPLSVLALQMLFLSSSHFQECFHSLSVFLSVWKTQKDWRKWQTYALHLFECFMVSATLNEGLGFPLWVEAGRGPVVTDGTFHFYLLGRWDRNTRCLYQLLVVAVSM